MAEPTDLDTTYSRAYNAAKCTGPSCCAHVAGLEAVADAAKRKVLDELISRFGKVPRFDSARYVVEYVRVEMDRANG